TIVCAGTLKGGACGESNRYLQYLAESYYDLTKNDFVKWQLMFDCSVRGVKLTKGDMLPGLGKGEVFAATGAKEHDEDSGRCGVAEAMVRSLELEGTAGEHGLWGENKGIEGHTVRGGVGRNVSVLFAVVDTTASNVMGARMRIPLGRAINFAVLQQKHPHQHSTVLQSIIVGQLIITT
ncbi:hypothetical protein ACHAWF_000840, partial [Thalassiosira exigua]